MVARQTAHCAPLCCQHCSCPSRKIVLHGSPERVGTEHRRTGGSAIIVSPYYFLAGTSRPSHFRLERPDGLSVLLTHVLFDVFAKDHEGVVVLFHATRRTLDGRFEPGCYTPVVKDVLALELLVIPLCRLKTDGTGLEKVCTTLPVFDCWVFALGSVQGQG